jgi:hypothetical protein
VSWNLSILLPFLLQVNISTSNLNHARTLLIYNASMMLDNLLVCICGLSITMLVGYLLSLLPAASALPVSSNGTTVSPQDPLSPYSGKIQSAFASQPQGVSEHKAYTDFDETDWAERCHHMTQRSSHTEEVKHICETRTLPAGNKRQTSCSYKPAIRRAVMGALAVTAAMYECQALVDNFANSCLAQPDDDNRPKFLRRYDCLMYGGALLIGFTTASTIQFAAGMYAETIAAWARTIMGNWLEPPKGRNHVVGVTALGTTSALAPKQSYSFSDLTG